MTVASAVTHGVKQAWGWFVRAVDPLSKLATIVAVVIAGIWTYHLHQITGESDVNPEVWVTAESLSYGKDTRLLVVHVRQKNVGRVPVLLDPDALSLAVKSIPEGLGPGFVDMDSRPTIFDEKALSKHAEDTDNAELSPGAEYEDVAEFVVAPGLYHIEATLALPDDYTVDSVAVQRVE